MTFKKRQKMSNLLSWFRHKIYLVMSWKRLVMLDTEQDAKLGLLLQPPHFLSTCFGSFYHSEECVMVSHQVTSS